VLSNDFTPDSDIDVLIEFEPNHVPGLEFIRIQNELSELFGGRKVDLVTPKFLNRRIRNKVQSEAVIQFVRR